MNCKTLHKELIFFLEGDLPLEKREQLEAHLNECPDCAAFAADIKKTLQVTENEKSTEVNPFFYTRVKAKLENNETQHIAAFENVFLRKVLQPVLFSILLIIGVYSGIKIGQPAPVNVFSSTQFDQETVPYLNEMETESIETFLME